MESQILMDEELFERVIDRLAHQLMEHHDFNKTDLVGLQPRGYDLARILKVKLEQLLPGSTINCGGLVSATVSFIPIDVYLQASAKCDDQSCTGEFLKLLVLSLYALWYCLNASNNPLVFSASK